MICFQNVEIPQKIEFDNIFLCILEGIIEKILKKNLISRIAKP